MAWSMSLCVGFPAKRLDNDASICSSRDIGYFRRAVVCLSSANTPFHHPSLLATTMGNTAGKRNNLCSEWPNSMAEEQQALIRNRRVHAQPVRQSMLPIFGLALHVALGRGGSRRGWEWGKGVVVFTDGRPGGQVDHSSGIGLVTKKQPTLSSVGKFVSRQAIRLLLLWGILMSWRGRISTPVASLLNHHKTQRTVW